MMERTGKIVLWTGVGVGVVGVGAWALLRSKKATARQSSDSSSVTTPHLTATELLWEPPAVYGTVDGLMAIGPSANPTTDPNGVYQLVTQFTAPVAGAYTLLIAPDDAVQVSIDGQVLGVVTGSEGAKTFSPILGSGPHVLKLTVSNNGMGGALLVPYQAGSPNPSGVAVQLVAPNGTTLITPGVATGWYYSGYLASLQVATNTPLTTSTVFA